VEKHAHPVTDQRHKLYSHMATAFSKPEHGRSPCLDRGYPHQRGEFQGKHALNSRGAVGDALRSRISANATCKGSGAGLNKGAVLAGEQCKRPAYRQLPAWRVVPKAHARRIHAAQRETA